MENLSLDRVTTLLKAHGFRQSGADEWSHETGLRCHAWDLHQTLHNRLIVKVEFVGPSVRKMNSTYFTDKIVNRKEREFCGAAFQTRLQRLIRAAKKA